MFKTETHVHTMPFSSTADLEPETMVQLYHAAGYDTVFISNHLSAGHFARLGSHLTFAQKVELYCDTYLRARAEGERLGLCVLFSAELALAGNDFLLYGISREFLALREDLFELTPQAFYLHAKRHGVTVVQAHPLRDGVCTPYPDCVDALEAVNTHPDHQNHSEQVLALAAAHGLPVSCGSDAHKPHHVGRCAMRSKEKITAEQQYVQLLLGGELELWVGR